MGKALEDSRLHVPNRGGGIREVELHLPADQVVEHGTAAAIGDVIELDAGLMLEHFEREVLHGAVARRRPVKAAGRRLGERDHVGHGLRLDRLVDDQQIGDERGQKDRLEVPDGVIRQIGVERRVHRVGGGVIHDGVAVAIRLGHRRGGDGAAGAAAIVDDELLAPHVAELLEQDAPHRVGAARRRIGNHHLDRPCRIAGLRRGGSSDRDERQRARRSLQYLPPRQSASCVTHCVPSRFSPVAGRARAPSRSMDAPQARAWGFVARNPCSALLRS
jgi:hypothetical protein